MSHHDDSVPLRHMLDACREAVQYSQGRSRTDLDSDRLFQLAMVRLVEVIGEAAGRLTKTTHARHPQIPWPQIISTRNRLIHGYDQIDHDILWNILTQDLPPLIPILEGILSKP
jgi:uncharacterized protein with HEPN domain